ncbi:MAG: hypothetical protein JWM89_2654 [Acidimicrobiales bacterium]|nr:hypothetical protein [Acidimicrobiales bacterium]
MDLLPPDPDQLATKADLALLRVDLAQAQADLRVEMSELRSELRGEMSYLRVDVKQEIAGLTRTYVLSSVGTVLTIVLAVGVLR